MPDLSVANAPPDASLMSVQPGPRPLHQLRSRVLRPTRFMVFRTRRRRMANGITL